jgi:RNA polymerase sigma factor (sigma-70 family)
MSEEDEKPTDDENEGEKTPYESDKEFMNRLRGGDDEAWKEAFRILFPIAFRSALRVLPNREDAEDVAMKTLAEVSKPGFLDKRCNTFDDFKNLTRTIAKRRAIDELRKGMAERRGAGKVDRLDEEKIDLAIALDSREDVELAELVGLVIQVAEEDLNEKERNVLFDRFTLGLKLREIAEKRDIKEGGVGVMLGRGIEKVRKGLRQRGWHKDGDDSGGTPI